MAKDLMKALTSQYMKNELPEMNIGDTVRVHVKIKEGSRERIQVFEGTIIAKKHGGIEETITVRRISYGVGCEKVFPVHAPNVVNVETVRHGKVRRAKLYYLRPRDDAEGRCTFSLPGMAFARDGSGGEYHLLEDGSIGYYSSEGEAGRLAESMDDLFSLLVSCICWHDCCDTKQYVDSKTLEEYGQRQRNCNLEDMDMDSLQQVSDALGIPNGEPLAPVLERFRKATQREPLYQCIFHEDDGSLTESYGLMFE